MELSEKGVELTGIVLAIIATAPVMGCYGCYTLRYLKKHQWRGRIDTSRSYPILLSVSGLLIALLMWYTLRFTESKMICLAGVILEMVATYCYFKPKYTRLKDESAARAAEDNPGSAEDNSCYARGMRNALLGVSWSPSAVCLLLFLGITGFLLWFLPDVAAVREDGAGYDVKRYFALPYEKGMRPGGSYLDNETGDTLFRILVSYSFPVEDKGNIYSVTEAYPPGTGIKMRSKPDYVMKRMPPWMEPSNGKLGSYRTCRRFIVDRKQIEAFARLDMKKAGLENNRLVDSIPEPRSTTIWEDKVKVNKYNVYW